jgi:hypothetical protein
MNTKSKIFLGFLLVIAIASACKFSAGETSTQIDKDSTNAAEVVVLPDSSAQETDSTATAK